MSSTVAAAGKGPGPDAMVPIVRLSETGKLQRSLLRTGRAIRRQHLYAALLSALVLGGYGAAVLFSFDWLVNFPFSVRWLLILGGGSVLLVHLSRSHLRHWRQRLDEIEVAIRLERLQPELQSRVVSTLQFQALPVVPPGMSGELIDGTVRQTLERRRQLAPGRLVEHDWLRRGLPRLLLLGLLGTAAWTLAPAHIEAFLRRLVDPAAAYPTRTVITALNVPGFVPKGDTTPITVSASGFLPGRGTLRLESGGESALIDLLPESEGSTSYRALLPPLRAPGRLMVLLGDDRRGPIEITPRARPTLAAMKLHIQPPAYTGLEAETIATGNARVLTGSKLTLTLTSSKPIDTLSLVSTTPSVDLSELETIDERSRQISLMVDDGFGYRIQLRDTDGLYATDLPTFRIISTVDRPPTIRVDRPRGALGLAPQSRFPLTVEIADDFGLADVELRYQILSEAMLASGDLERAPVRSYQSWQTFPDPLRLRIDQQIEMARIGAPIGSQVRMWLEASDYSPATQRSISNPILIRIISAEEYRNLLWSQLGEAIRETDNVILDLQGSERALERLAPTRP